MAWIMIGAVLMAGVLGLLFKAMRALHHAKVIDRAGWEADHYIARAREKVRKRLREGTTNG